MNIFKKNPKGPCVNASSAHSFPPYTSRRDQFQSRPLEAAIVCRFSTNPRGASYLHQFNSQLVAVDNLIFCNYLDELAPNRDETSQVIDNEINLLGPSYY